MATVEQCLRGEFNGFVIDDNVLVNASLSPMTARPQRMGAINLDDAFEEMAADDEWFKSYRYALSTLYYSMAAGCPGGSRSEQDGDVRASITTARTAREDREYFRKCADKIRKELGCEVEEDNASASGMFDASFLGRTAKTAGRWS